MADITPKINQPISEAVVIRWKDMGDGTYAQVVSVGGTVTTTAVLAGTVTVTNTAASPLYVAGTATIPASAPGYIAGTVTAPAAAPLYVAGTVTAPQAAPLYVAGTVTAPAAAPLYVTGTATIPASAPGYVAGTVSISTDPVPTRDTWRAAATASETTNDSDISFTVTASQEWQIQSIWAELVTTADVGNRQVVVEIQDGAADVMAQVRAGATRAASGTLNYLFAPGVADLTAARDTDSLMTPIPAWVLPAGYIVRVYDKAAVAGTADDMVVQMMYAYRAV